MHVVSFISASGGVGKTTLSLLTAGAYAMHGKRVSLVDLDSSATATMWTVGDHAEDCNLKTLLQRLVDFKTGRVGRPPDAEECVRRVRVVGTHSEFHLLPGGNLDDVAGEVKNLPKWSDLLVDLLGPLVDTHDIVILDSPNWVYWSFPMTIPLSSFYVAITRPGEAEVKKTAVFLQRVYAVMRNQFGIDSPDLYISVLLNQIRDNRVDKIAEAWEETRNTITKAFPNITVIKWEERAKYYSDKVESEFYGFKLKNGLGIEEYREKGHVLKRDKGEDKLQFEAYFKALNRFIESTAPYGRRVE